MKSSQSILDPSQEDLYQKSKNAVVEQRRRGGLTLLTRGITQLLRRTTGRDISNQNGWLRRSGPRGMSIVLAGQKDLETLIAESQALVDEVERYIGLR